MLGEQRLPIWKYAPTSNAPPNNNPQSIVLTNGNFIITDEIREYRGANNLCMSDGRSCRIHNCAKLIAKCIEQRKPTLVDPVIHSYKFRDVMADVLALDEFSREPLKHDLTETWHLDDGAL